MSFEINVDKYSFAAEPEKASQNYAAELAKKLVEEERAERSGEDASLSAIISTETEQRKSKYDELTLYISELNSKIAAESVNRASQDQTLSDAISLEVSQRKKADSDMVFEMTQMASQLEERINSEVEERALQDSRLSQRIDGCLTEHQDISGKADKGTTLAEYGITDAISITREVYEDEIDSLVVYGGMRLYKVIGSSNNLNYNEVNFTPYYLLVTQKNDKAWQYRIYNGIYQCRDGETSLFSDTVWNEWKELITSDYTYNKTDIDDKLTVLDGIQADILSLEGSVASHSMLISEAKTDQNLLSGRVDGINEYVNYLSSDITLMGNTLNELNSIKADKTTIVTDESSTSYTFDFSDMYNKEMRLQAASSISIKFVDNEYAEDYISGLSFNSGETPTSFDYADSGIINWVGTDCVKDGDLSIFEPSANTHYDIVFYFNGVQFIGLVNGYVPASGNEVAT